MEKIGKVVVIKKALDCIENLRLQKEDYIIVYGAAMVLRDVKEKCGDIDITLAPSAFDRIEKEYGLTKKIYNPDVENNWYIKYDDTIDLFRGSYGCATDPVGTEMQFGLIVQTIVSLRNEKFKRGREKDMKDVDILNRIIKSWGKEYHIGKY